MTDDMTLAKIPWRPFQNSKLPKQSIGLGRQTLSVCPTELLKGQRGGIVKERERERADVWSLGGCSVSSLL